MKKRKQSTARRTLYYYWKATRKHLPFFLLGLITTLGFSFFLSFANPYIVGKIVDRVAEGSVPAENVLEVFMPFIITKKEAVIKPFR